MSDSYGSSPLPPAPPSSFRAGGCLKWGLIGCGGLIALGIIITIAGGVWWNSNRDELESGAQVAAREGARFGLVRDEAACFEEGKRRTAESSGFQGTFTAGAFLRVCLEYSRPTPGYCDNVPPPTSIGRSAAWQSQRCGDDLACRNVSQVVQTYCNEGRPKRQASDTLMFADSAGVPGPGGAGNGMPDSMRIGAETDSSGY